MEKTLQKDSDEHYDRRQKAADEIFCVSCGAIIKKEAELCPKCGVRNKKNEDEEVIVKGSKPKGSIALLVLLIIIFWPIAIWYGVTRRFK